MSVLPLTPDPDNSYCNKSPAPYEVQLMRSLLFPAAGAFVLLAALLLTPAPRPMTTLLHEAPTQADLDEHADALLDRLAARYGTPDQAPEPVRSDWLGLLEARRGLSTSR